MDSFSSYLTSKLGPYLNSLLNKPPSQFLDLSNLPRDIWCLIVKKLTLIPDIVRMIRVQRRFRQIIYDSVEHIQYRPDEMVPFWFLARLKSLRYVGSEIFVGDPESLISLAELPLTYYRIVLGVQFGNQTDNVSTRKLIAATKTFLETLRQKPVEHLSVHQVFLRPSASLFMKALRQVGAKSDPSFILEKGKLITSSTLYQEDLLPVILEFIQSLGPRITTLESPTVLAFGLLPPFNRLIQYIQAINSLPHLTTIELDVTAMAPHVPYYLEALSQFQTIRVLRANPHPTGPTIMTRPVYFSIAQGSDQLHQAMINRGIRCQKEVDIILPLSPAGVGLVFQIYPNLRKVGVLEPPNLRELRDLYPTLTFTIFTSTPSKYPMDKELDFSLY